MSRRGVRRPMLAVLLGAVVLALAAPAAAQTSGTGGNRAPTTPTTASGGSVLTLISQDPWTPVGGDARIGLAVTGPPPGATLSVTAYQALSGRKQFDAAALGAAQPSVLSQLTLPLGAVEVDDAGVSRLTVGLQSPTGPRDPGRLNVRRPGVYPVDIELRNADDQPTATLRTMLVVSEAERATVAEPLRVAWVWPVTAPPSFLPGGDPDREVLAAMRPNGRLGRMAAALEGSDVPVTLAPTAETVEAWAQNATSDPAIQSSFDDLRTGSAGRDILGGPYVPVDLPALLDHQLGDAVDDVLARGNEVLAPTLGVAVDPRTRLLRPASPGALGRLRVAGADRVIVAGDGLATAPETRFTLAQPVTLTAPTTLTQSEPVTALASDVGLQTLLDSDLPPAQRVQLVLAGLAVIAQETPAVPRVVTIVNPDDFDAPTELYSSLLAGLKDNPFLRPVTTTQAFDTIPVDPPAPTVNASQATSDRTLATTASPEPAISASAYRNQRTRLDAFATLSHPGDPGVAQADRSLLASVATGWPIDVGEARAEAHLRVVDREIGRLLAEIEVPDPRTITLTSRSGEIPLTFRNETGYPVRLRASLASEKLFFPEGNVIDLELPPRSTTVRVAVEARTSGTFPLDLEVTSADGVLSISQRRLEVRSTFVSTVGVVLMVSAVVFLALWWGFDLHRRRKRRRHPSTT